MATLFTRMAFPSKTKRCPFHRSNPTPVLLRRTPPRQLRRPKDWWIWTRHPRGCLLNSLTLTRSLLGDRLTMTMAMTMATSTAMRTMIKDPLPNVSGWTSLRRSLRSHCMKTKLFWPWRLTTAALMSTPSTLILQSTLTQIPAILVALMETHTPSMRMVIPRAPPCEWQDEVRLGVVVCCQQLAGRDGDAGDGVSWHGQSHDRRAIGCNWEGVCGGIIIRDAGHGSNTCGTKSVVEMSTHARESFWE
jgi:hypothetical protein